MKIVIVGSGVIGVTCAWVLRRRGHEVHVIEREPAAGLQTSHANGGFLSPSTPEPWNTPGCWRTLAGSFFTPAAPLKLRLAALPGLASWGIAFLANSRTRPFTRNYDANLRIALYSMGRLKALREETGIAYAGAARGSLRLFRNAAALEASLASSLRLGQGRIGYRAVTPAGAVALEPALEPIARQLAGAIHSPDDESGDAWRYCEALAAQARRIGVEFHFGATVSGLAIEGRRATGVRLADGASLRADRTLVCAASYSTPLLRPAGVRLPVRPAKGYSVTFDRVDGEPALGMPLSDDDLHAVVTPLDGVIRAAGTAEFAGFDLTLRPERVRNLLGLVQQLLPGRPQLAPERARAWCGLRPMSVDGVPIIGPTGIEDLYVSTGHGPLGWTMAAGTAELTADLICGTAPGIDPAPYALGRFG